MIRVLLVDDHEIVRRALCDMLELGSDVTVVGQAASVAEARAEGVRLTGSDIEVDVAVVDFRLPDGDAIDVIHTLAVVGGPIPSVVLTAFDDDESVVRCADAGARGFVLKSARVDTLMHAIRAAALGRSVMDPARVAAARRRVGRQPAVERLSGRERQVFDEIGAGRSNREIGERLGLAEKTVKNYTSSILMKLGMTRRTEVAALAARLDRRLAFASVGEPTTETGA